MIPARRGRGDEGFTLPEVLLTVVMLGIIMSAIAGAMLTVIGPDQQAADRLRASHDGQLLALHLPRDLQSASPTVADTAPGASIPCGGAVSGTNVLRLEWTQPEPTSRSFAVSYRTEQVGSEWQLVRFSCENGGSVDRLVVARDLADGGSAVAAIDGAVVSITVTGRTGRAFTVSGTRRTPDNECRVTDFSLAYTELPLGDPSGHLLADVLTTVELAGPCSGVQLRVVFSPNGGTQSLALGGSSGAIRSANIGMNAYTWSVGDETFTVERVDGLPIPAPTATLTLTPYVPPCVASTITPTPSTVALGDAQGHLAQDVVVTVSPTGPCGPLELVFALNVLDEASGTDEVLPINAAGQVIIPRDAFMWQTGDRTLRVRNTTTGLEVGDVSLTVTPYVCAVQSVVAAPATVTSAGGNGSNDRLDQDVAVTVTSTGPCAGLQLRFTPTSAPATDVTLTAGPGGTWTYTIAGTGTPGAVNWSKTSHTLQARLSGTNVGAPGTLTVTRQ